MSSNSSHAQKRKAEVLEDPFDTDYLYTPPSAPAEIRAKFQNFACFDVNCEVEKYPYPCWTTEYHYHRLFKIDGTKPLEGKEFYPLTWYVAVPGPRRKKPKHNPNGWYEKSRQRAKVRAASERKTRYLDPENRRLRQIAVDEMLNNKTSGSELPKQEDDSEKETDSNKLPSNAFLNFDLDLLRKSLMTGGATLKQHKEPSMDLDQRYSKQLSLDTLRPNDHPPAMVAGRAKPLSVNLYQHNGVYVNAGEPSPSLSASTGSYRSSATSSECSFSSQATCTTAASIPGSSIVAPKKIDTSKCKTNARSQMEGVTIEPKVVPYYKVKGIDRNNPAYKEKVLYYLAKFREQEKMSTFNQELGQQGSGSGFANEKRQAKPHGAIPGY